MQRKKNTYFENIGATARSLWAGLRITFSHMLKSRRSRKPIIVSDKNYFEVTEGINTIQYPYEMQPVPDNGRYRLHNEIDDCIVCDKCAKICPVDCIEIEPVKAIEEFGKTSDGTPKRIYAAKFDIDMAKCCFCGLCTTVCPTECLTMTKVYDFSVTDIREHNFVFGEMTPAQIAEKKAAYEQHQAEKAKAKAASAVVASPSTDAPPAPAKPVFKPRMKPPGSAPSS